MRREPEPQTAADIGRQQSSQPEPTPDPEPTPEPEPTPQPVQSRNTSERKTDDSQQITMNNHLITMMRIIIDN